MTFNWYFKQEKTNDRTIEGMNFAYEHYAWQPEELKNTVQSAQRYEQAAIDKLCTRFEPLIMKALYDELHGSKVNWSEARNYAWTQFLDLVMNYHGDRYSELPGLIHLRIHDRLKRYRAHGAYTNSKEGANDELETFTESTSEQDTFLQDDVAHLCGASSAENLLKELHTAIDQLPPDQRYVVESFYLDKQKQTDIANRMSLSKRQVINIKNKALENLANELLS